jgi:uncharacterized protein (TIGR03067 family)
MTRRFGAAALTLFVIAAVPTIAAQDTPAPAKLTGVMAQVQGVWTMTSSNGQDTAASGQQIVMSITNNRYEQTVNGQLSERGTFKLDESKKPMTVDVTITDGPSAGQTALGVFELNGNTLTVKVAQPGSTERPTDLAPADGFVTFVMVKKSSGALRF